MRLALVTMLAFIAGPAVAQDLTPAALAGTWNVTSTTTSHGSCQQDPGAVHAYIWILSVTSDGTLTATVQGETAFPKLIGKISNGQLRLGGWSTSAYPAGVWSQTTFDLKLENGQLVGSRVYAGTEAVTLTGGGAGRAGCFHVSSIVAQR